jgi:hypothetical protein
MQKCIAACYDRQIAIEQRGVRPIFRSRSDDRRLALPFVFPVRFHALQSM